MEYLENINFFANKLTIHILIILSIILIPHEVGWRWGMKFTRQGSQVYKIVLEVLRISQIPRIPEEWWLKLCHSFTASLK